MKNTPLLFVCCLVLPLAVKADPYVLDYSVAALGNGTYNYTFQMTLDNHDHTWQAGQNINWIIFSDGGNDGTSGNLPSPLTAFQGDPGYLSLGPFTDYNTSSGGFNGATLLQTQGNTDVNTLGWFPGSVDRVFTGVVLQELTLPKAHCTLAPSVDTGLSPTWTSQPG